VDLTVRPARASDADPVRAFVGDTWSERTDYLGDVIGEWVTDDDPDARTLVAEADGVVGVVRAVVLSEHEAWLHGLRVAPQQRDAGVGTALVDAAFGWAADRGRTVARAWVFGWNEMGLGLARAAGFDAGTVFRFAEPDPATGETRETTANAAWTRWAGSDARDHLRGLALDPAETWALSELTRERLAEGTLPAAGHGFAWRTRVTESEERVAEYGAAVWEQGRAGALFDAVAADAAAAGADRARMLVPETAAALADAAAARVALDDETHVTLRADLSGRTERS
jgi:GNAT superfamily N-acetyltransferase